MKFTTPLVALSLAGCGLASFDIFTNTDYLKLASTTYSDSAALASASSVAASVEKEYTAALTSYEAEITKAPEWTSAWQILNAYQLTGKDVPSEVTADDKHTQYTTTPDWFKAMPTDAKKYFESIFAKENDIFESAIAKVERGAAPAKSSHPGVLLCGAAVAVFVGAVGAL